MDSGKAVRVQFGASLNATIVKEIIENVLLNTKLAVFAPYDAFTSQVVNWNTVITFRINKFLSANLALDVAYDPKVIITRDDGTRGPVGSTSECVRVRHYTSALSACGGCWWWRTISLRRAVQASSAC